MSKKRMCGDADSRQISLDLNPNTPVTNKPNSSNVVVSLNDDVRFVNKKYEKVDRALNNIMNRAKELAW